MVNCTVSTPDTPAAMKTQMLDMPQMVPPPPPARGKKPAGGPRKVKVKGHTRTIAPRPKAPPVVPGYALGGQVDPWDQQSQEVPVSATAPAAPVAGYGIRPTMGMSTPDPADGTPLMIGGQGGIESRDLGFANSAYRDRGEYDKAMLARQASNLQDDATRFRSPWQNDKASLKARASVLQGQATALGRTSAPGIPGQPPLGVVESTAPAKSKAKSPWLMYTASGAPDMPSGIGPVSIGGLATKPGDPMSLTQPPQGYEKGGVIAAMRGYVDELGRATDTQMRPPSAPEQPGQVDQNNDPPPVDMASVMRDIRSKNPPPQMPKGYAKGGEFMRHTGKVHGGTKGKDSVPLLGMPGEYMLPKPAADALGGPRYLDQVVRETTGREPGPTPVKMKDGRVVQGRALGGATYDDPEALAREYQRQMGRAPESPPVSRDEGMRRVNSMMSPLEPPAAPVTAQVGPSNSFGLQDYNSRVGRIPTEQGPDSSPESQPSRTSVAIDRRKAADLPKMQQDVAQALATPVRKSNRLIPNPLPRQEPLDENGYITFDPANPVNARAARRSTVGPAAIPLNAQIAPPRSGPSMKDWAAATYAPTIQAERARQANIAAAPTNALKTRASLLGTIPVVGNAIADTANSLGAGVNALLDRPTMAIQNGVQEFVTGEPVQAAPAPPPVASSAVVTPDPWGSDTMSPVPPPTKGAMGAPSAPRLPQSPVIGRRTMADRVIAAPGQDAEVLPPRVSKRDGYGSKPIYGYDVPQDQQAEFGRAIFSDSARGTTPTGLNEDIRKHGQGAVNPQDWYNGADVSKMSPAEFQEFKTQGQREQKDREAARLYLAMPEGVRPPAPPGVAAALTPGIPVSQQLALGVEQRGRGIGAMQAEQAGKERIEAIKVSGKILDDKAAADRAWSSRFANQLNALAKADGGQDGGGTDPENWAWATEQGSRLRQRFVELGAEPPDANQLAGIAAQAARKRLSLKQAMALPAVLAVPEAEREALAKKYMEESEAAAAAMFDPLTNRSGLTR